jgi:hypothetical protein
MSNLLTITPEDLTKRKDATVTFIRDTLTALPTYSADQQQIAIEEAGKALAYLGDLTDTAMALWQTTGETFKETLAETLQELDEAQREYAYLYEAVKKGDRSHPLVKDVTANIRRDVQAELNGQQKAKEWQMRQKLTAEVYDKARATVVEVLVDYLHFMLKVDMPEARRFAALVLDGDMTDIEPTHLKKLGQVINRVVAGAQYAEVSQ